ncbi:hypothetical protein IWX83_002714 [Flavobacterium sp. CG_9.1]|jgi:hypothetical protein|uniref:hypothetical protein n=1 Tax=Flavobacterium sp. CG_9.1 TaxID=2787728 RepID=UPI0018CBCA58|nr:hypothetical protein [Flavobacterium sp. CG_9.1]MBG6062908.1 hypothetical protein [Flavobacterium sp. CG_9.1]
MMNDKFYRPISAYTAVSDIIAKTDRILGKTSGISVAIEKSTSFMRDAENVTKYARSVMPLLDSIAWFKNDALVTYSNSASVAMDYSLAIDYPKLPTVPKLILDLNNTTNSALKGVFTTQSNWQMIMPAISESSAEKNAINIISGLNAASKSMADVVKISESIFRFDSNIKNLYKLINGLDEYDDEFQIDIDGQLTAALTYDIDNATSEGNKIAITYVTKYILDTFSEMSENYKSGKDKELFVKWITDFLDNLKDTGVRVIAIKLLVCCIVVPLFSSVKEMLMDDKVSKETIYITESAFETVTTNIKFLKESPDNRLKVKFTIPIGTKLTVLQNEGKWIKVKFVSDCVYYSGWTLNNNL